MIAISVSRILHHQHPLLFPHPVLQDLCRHEILNQFQVQRRHVRYQQFLLMVLCAVLVYLIQMDGLIQYILKSVIVGGSFLSTN